jgi:alkanesulfonate monooxygenase SsuD/methylene tetrahydromethanopterin reductase-like flavin-dependent oxidoreductase (luciferase family)
MILGLRPGALGEGAALADQAGFDFVLLGAGPGQGTVGEDPLSVAAFLMTATSRIGLAAGVPTSWAPFNVARALASFDRLSGGRCGWLPLPEPGFDAARSAEHLDVVRQLFDSWDDAALVFDKAAAVFADRGKVRRIRHSGAYYTVDGPLNAPRPLQGHPVLFQSQSLAQAGEATDVVLARLDALRPGTRAVPHALLLAEVPFGGGATDDIEETLAGAFASGACDGFVLAPADPLADTALLIETVLPRLRARGLAGPWAGSGDFRTRLGLPRPQNRFAS